MQKPRSIANKIAPQTWMKNGATKVGEPAVVVSGSIVSIDESVASVSVTLIVTISTVVCGCVAVALLMVKKASACPRIPCLAYT